MITSHKKFVSIEALAKVSFPNGFIGNPGFKVIENQWIPAKKLCGNDNKKSFARASIFLIFLMSLFIFTAGCGGGGGSDVNLPPITGDTPTGDPSDTTPPQVTSTYPSNGATGFPLNSAISATFSEAMNTSTINNTTFTLSGITGTVSYSGTTAYFTPSSNLSSNTTYTATIAAGVKDLAGNQMAASYSWSFETGTTSDTIAPTDPAGLTATAISSSQINLSWTASTDSGGSDLAGYTIERCSGAGCTNFTLIATPTLTTYSDTGLTASASYSYRVRAYDNAGNNSGYSNTASATTPDTTAPTNTTSANFINSGATYTTSTSVTLSISATDGVGVTGYYASESSTTPSASATGWTAITSTTSYSTSVSFTLSSGDGTKTVYVWFKDGAGNVSTPVSDSITLDTTPPIISNISSNSITSSSATIIWTTDEPATSQVEYGTTSAYGSQTTLSSTPITGHSQSLSGLQASTTYHYRVNSADAADNLALSVDNSFISSAPPDTTITSTPSSLTNSTSASFSFTSIDTGLTFECLLDAGAFATCTSPQSYTALTTGNHTFQVRARDAAGTLDPTPASYTWTIDTTAPTNTTSANFINSGTTYTNSTSVTLSISATDGVGVTGYYASESSTTPSASATGWTAITSTTSYSTSVSFTLSSGDGTKTVYVWFKDGAGNVSTSVSDSITLDTTPPTVLSSSISPSNGATNVSVNTLITATFSETMDGTTFTSATFTLTSGAEAVSGIVSFAGDTATFTPSGSLSYSTPYTVTITTGVKDLAGNQMASDYPWAFTTRQPGTATLTWDAPTENIDGTPIIPLIDLAGYIIYYGTQTGGYTQSIDVDNVLTYTINNLTDGLTYYFVVTAYNLSGIESDYSNEVFTIIP